MFKKKEDVLNRIYFKMKKKRNKKKRRNEKKKRIEKTEPNIESLLYVFSLSQKMYVSTTFFFFLATMGDILGEGEVNKGGGHSLGGIKKLFLLMVVHGSVECYLLNKTKRKGGKKGTSVAFFLGGGEEGVEK